MKKLLLSLLFLCSMAQATTVPIVWPFSPASNQANALRLTIEHANKIQKKYNFVFENKPGAGGAIAVNQVLNTKTPVLLMTSTSFFVRPFYYPNESYDVEQLEPVYILSTDSPIAVISKNVSSVADLKERKSTTIGVIAGSITEMVGRTLQKSVGDKLVIVPYQTTIAATRDAVGGHVDMSVEFIKDAVPWIEDNTLKSVGITGTKGDKIFRTFGAQGIHDLDNLVSNYYLLTNKNMSPEMLAEMHEIFNYAATQQDVVQVWQGDRAAVNTRNLKDTKSFWNKQKDFWTKK